MRRGEMWWGELPAPRTIRNIPVEVQLDAGDGLPSRCVANLDDIAPIPKTLIRQRISVLSAEKMQEVEAAIPFALDLT